MTGSGLHDGPGGWRLAPEGAAVYPPERTAVIADVHLGYEWARAGTGDCVPTHSLAETIARLAALLARVAVDRLVVAGDLVETRKPCPSTARDRAALESWLSARGVTLVPLAGNHDPVGGRWAETLDVAGWTIGHGHRPLPGRRTIRGHHHPLLRASGVSAPCFLVTASSIVLPAFSPNAAGTSLSLLSPSVARSAARCVATTGAELLDFGRVSDLLRALKIVGR
jgi:putative SbcD/Mre11-related phosphoesterase